MVEEEKQMKKFRNIILAVVVLVILVGAYVLLSNTSKENEISESQSENQKELSDVSKDKITKIILKSAEDEIMIERKNEQWILSEQESIELDQTKADDLAYSFAMLSADRIVEEEPRDLEKYGLNPSAVIAKAILDDGSEIEYYLGNMTPERNTYYFMRKDDSKVYTIWKNHGSNFSLSVNDLRNKKLTAINSQELKYLFVQQEGKPIIEISSNTDENLNAYGWGLWIMEQPYNHTYTVESGPFIEILEKGFNYTIKEFIEDNPSNFSMYGLDHPRAEIKLQDVNNTLHLLIGSNKDEESVYFKTKDDDGVYTIDSSQLQPLFDMEPFDLIDRFVYIADIKTVDAIKVEAEGKVYNMSLSRTGKESENGDEEEIINLFTVDGKEVDDEAFRDYYQSLIGIIFDAEMDKDMNDKDSEVSTTFTLNTGETIVIDYVSYNKDFYAVFRDGTSDFVVSKKKVNNMLDTLEKLINGELKGN